MSVCHAIPAWALRHAGKSQMWSDARLSPPDRIIPSPSGGNQNFGSLAYGHRLIAGEPSIEIDGPRVRSPRTYPNAHFGIGRAAPIEGSAVTASRNGHGRRRSQSPAAKDAIRTVDGFAQFSGCD